MSEQATIESGTATATPDPIETQTSGGAEPTGGTEQSAGPSGAEASGDAPAAGNRWEALLSKVSNLGESARSATPAAEGTPTGEGAAKKDGEEGDGKPSGEAKDGQPAKSETSTFRPTRAKILDAKGEEFELEWPEGTRISFKADRREVVVNSLDELVDLAQQGVHMHRRSTEYGQRESGYKQRIGTLEELLVRTTFDPEARRAVAKELRKVKDPEVREAFHAKAELDDLKARGKERAAEESAETRAEGLKRFWGAVRSQAESSLAEYPHLDASDIDDVVESFHRGYEQHSRELVARYVELAPEHGISEEDARAQAVQDASRYFTEENLFRQMKALNDRYGRKAGSRSPGSSETPRKVQPSNRGDAAAEDEAELDEAEGLSAAERHNAHVNSKITQRDERRGARRGGHMPAGRGGDREASEGGTWEERMERIRQRVRKAAGG